MTIDEVLQLTRARSQKDLHPVQEILLRQVWEGKTYTSIASASHYGEHYLRNIASGLWQSLSEIFHIPISKSNFRSSIESRSLTAEEAELIEKFTRSQCLATPLEYPGSPVPLGSPFYINHPLIEELAYQEIAKPGSVLRIKAPRKMGKSSLLLRILDRANSLGYRTVSLDFQQAEEAVLDNLDKFLRWFCANISRHLDLPPLLDDFWDEDMGSKVSCTIYLQQYILTEINRPLVLALNEVNRIFEYPKIAREFLPLLRSWHEEAKRNKTLEKLRLIVLHSTEIYIPLKLTESPFNVGLPLQLPYFTEEQILALAQRYGLDWTDSPDAERLMAMVGGHPYLVRLAFYHLYQKAVTLDMLLQEAPTIGGIYKDYLRNFWVTLQADTELAIALKQVVKSERGLELEPVVACKLVSMGLIHIDNNRCTLSCELYRLYFGSPNFI
ncbi:AAA-like domain-containing protein [Tychonema sp. LEGE 07199]|uniref:AAA-like domain-containing protein n=1 Tax=unclassified Tychonema TaxID=2642144 RepID=UPI00187DFC6C|nr:MULTISPECIES: AAA-like domain-containing protein [unclassified Tychonema]MBE9123375.1 AAA-like domain-containing protein [Tychonema sp. LEGE 07199]MBE9130291.1 AAA-like domain-containing protein [Tychonema sp. LEGE 07196]